MVNFPLIDNNDQKSFFEPQPDRASYKIYILEMLSHNSRAIHNPPWRIVQIPGSPRYLLQANSIKTNHTDDCTHFNLGQKYKFKAFLVPGVWEIHPKTTYSNLIFTL